MAEKERPAHRRVFQVFPAGSRCTAAAARRQRSPAATDGDRPGRWQDPAAGLGRRETRRDHSQPGQAGVPGPPRQVPASRAAARAHARRVQHLSDRAGTRSGHHPIRVEPSLALHPARRATARRIGHPAWHGRLARPLGRRHACCRCDELHRQPDNTWPVGHGAPPEGAPGSSLTTGHGVFHSGALHVVERFTPVDADTINYQATIEDPNVFTQPWTVKYDGLRRAPADHMLYEYACHEGNARNLKLMTGIDTGANVAVEHVP